MVWGCASLDHEKSQDPTRKSPARAGENAAAFPAQATTTQIPIKSTVGDELRPEYRREDIRKGVRGKYFASYQKGSNLVLLNPAVNEALRGLLQLTERTKKLTRRAGRTTAWRRAD